jgi:hypothetical protein
MVKIRKSRAKVAQKKKSNSSKSSLKKKQSNSNVQKSMNMPTKVQTHPMVPRGVHEKVCAITDPFCANARGARYPDGAGGNTLTFQVRAHVSLATLSVGGTVAYFLGSLPYSYIQAASYSAGNYTLNTTYTQTTQAQTWAAYLGTYRLTTAGIIIRNVLPALTAQGYIIVSKETTPPPVSSVIAAGDVYGNEVETRPLFAGQEVSVMFKPVGSIARTFSGGNSSTTTNTGWDNIKIEVSGGPASTTVLDVEILYNVEFQLNLSNEGLHQFIANQNAAPAQHAIEASNNVISKMGSIVTGGVEDVGAKVLDKVKNTVEEFLTGGFELLFG